ncbi:MAG TPA: NBR1-Ig-like domain-containing protein, partial [Longimicrobium sp.]
RASAPDCGPGRVVPTFMRAERIADGTVVAPGALLRKEWTLNNHGDCTWAAGTVRLRFVRAEPEFPHGAMPDVVVDQDVPPSGTFTFRAPFHAPTGPGSYMLHWQVLGVDGRPVKVSATKTIWASITVRANR